MLSGGRLLSVLGAFGPTLALGFLILTKFRYQELETLLSSWNWRPSGTAPEPGRLGISENPTILGTAFDDLAGTRVGERTLVAGSVEEVVIR